MSTFFEYMNFFAVLIGAALWCWGIFTLFRRGYLLERIGNIIRIDDPFDDDNSPPLKTGSWISKPLFDCPPCMASVHGFIFGALTFGITLELPAFMICLCGLNYIIKSIIFPEYE